MEALGSTQIGYKPRLPRLASCFNWPLKTCATSSIAWTVPPEVVRRRRARRGSYLRTTSQDAFARARLAPLPLAFFGFGLAAPGDFVAAGSGLGPRASEA